MKIICLNLWSGRKKDMIVDFIRQHQDIDVFCFQEIYHDAYGKETYWLESELNLLNILRGEFPNHQVLFTPSLLDYWGMAFMVKKYL
jgi:hypothetical protein